MAEFNKAIGVVLEHEGGLVNHPSDPGGTTNYGISLRFALSELQKDNDKDGFLDGDFDEDGDVDADDIRKLTIKDAMEIYRKHWWDKFHYALISDQDIATKIFDMAINMGHVRAHKIVQEVLKVKADGVLGVKTLSEINSSEPISLLTQICTGQLEFYKRLVAQKPSMAVFYKGWKRRAAWPFKSLK